MPTIDVSYKDLCKLIGRPISHTELQEKAVLFAKGEIDAIEGDMLKIDIKDTNRPDLWSVEGVAREIAGRHGKPGLPVYKTGRSDVKVTIDHKLKNIRPYTVCAVVKNLSITPDVLSQMIQLQEKVAGTFGRNRKEVAIGVYDLHKITPPIRFTTTKPEGIKFVPLEFAREMTPKQILKIHPKGKEFAHLLEDNEEYPIFIDNADEVLSMPPIINSDYTGKVTEKTKDIFIECSGFNLKFLIPALNVIVSALAERGGQIETVEVHMPGGKKLVTPDLTPKKTSVQTGFVNKLSGLNLNEKEICRLLEQARYRTALKGKTIELQYPAYRQDIMHPVDVVEDAIISYGYNKIEPVVPQLATVGSQTAREKFSDTVSQIMTGLGSQEIMSYILTSKANLFEKMNKPQEQVVEIENIVSSNWCVFRNALLPELLEFLSQNKHVEYPQKIFEIGDTVLINQNRKTKTEDMRRISMATSGNTAGYEQVASDLDSLLQNLGIKYRLKNTSHPSFIRGRTASVIINNRIAGIIGEINPLVLEKWDLEKPVAGFELDLGLIFELL